MKYILYRCAQSFAVHQKTIIYSIISGGSSDSNNGVRFVVVSLLIVSSINLHLHIYLNMTLSLASMIFLSHYNSSDPFDTALHSLEIKRRRRTYL